MVQRRRKYSFYCAFSDRRLFDESTTDQTHSRFYDNHLHIIREFKLNVYLE